jgi:NAD(P)-dependent dehydrogenase (short-subunit alcohol dehydrogenase family)
MMADGFTDKDVPIMTGKTALITGGNAGLGFETAKVLAAKGATVIIACRSAEKAEAALNKIRAVQPGASISALMMDLGDLGSVRRAVSELDDLPCLDLLINNAGIMTPPYELTIDGFESQFGVNHLGPFALTGLLLDKLISTSEARIVNTSSLAGRNGKFLFDDINAEHSYKTMERYAMSKRANLVFSNELNRRLKSAGAKAISVACHPGIANTELSRYMPRWFSLVEPMVKYLFNTPAQGAWPTLQAATGRGVRGGDYYGPSKRRQTSGPSIRVATGGRDLFLASRLWEVSVEMTGVDYL